MASRRHQNRRSRAVDRVIESARELDKAAENMRGRREDDFGQRLTAAVKRKLGKRACQTPHVTADADDESSFGEKLKQAVQKKVGQRQR
jgi:hypothetical protein